MVIFFKSTSPTFSKPFSRRVMYNSPLGSRDTLTRTCVITPAPLLLKVKLRVSQFQCAKYNVDATSFAPRVRQMSKATSAPTIANRTCKVLTKNSFPSGAQLYNKYIVSSKACRCYNSNMNRIISAHLVIFWA